MLPHRWGKPFLVRSLYFSLLVAKSLARSYGIGGNNSRHPRQTRHKPHTATFPGLLGFPHLWEYFFLSTRRLAIKGEL